MAKHSNTDEESLAGLRSSPEVNKPPLNFEDLNQAWFNLAKIISTAYLGTSLGFILGVLGISVGIRLDDPLDHALYAFTISLPILIFAWFLSYVRLAGFFAYFMACTGGWIVQFGLYQILWHLDQNVANMFIIEINICNTLLVLVSRPIIKKLSEGNKRTG